MKSGDVETVVVTRAFLERVEDHASFYTDSISSKIAAEAQAILSAPKPPYVRLRRELVDAIADQLIELGNLRGDARAVNNIKKFCEPGGELDRATEHGSDADPAPVASDISPRELEVLALVANGLSDKEVGTRLSISYKTVKGHMVSISAKLGQTGRVGIVMEALRRGLIEVKK